MKVKQRMLALLLCFVLCVGTIPSNAVASMQDSEEIVAVLPPETTSYTVASGTAQEEIGLPESLEIKVAMPAETEGMELVTRDDTAEVNWTGDYQADKPGDYELVAELSASTLKIADDVVMPVIHVTVIEEDPSEEVAGVPFDGATVYLATFAQVLEATGESGIRLRNFKITETISGVWDKDDSDGDGNDSSRDNATVLSLDQISYITSYSTVTNNYANIVTGGKYYFKAVLPCGESVATWNTSGGWMEGVQITKSDKEQVLTCSLDMEGAQSAPRVGNLEWIIDVNSTTNGDTIPKPTFTMWVGQPEETDSITDDGKDMTVSAAPNYNIQIKYEGVDAAGNRAWTAAVQLKAQSPEKGMLGLAPATDSLSFDIDLTKGQKLVDGKLNNATDTATNILASEYGALAPFDDGAATKAVDFRTVYNGGTLSLTGQGSDKIHVELTGIEIPEGFYANWVTHNAGKTNKNQSADYGEDTYNFAAIYFTTTEPADAPSDGTSAVAAATLNTDSFKDITANKHLEDAYEEDNTAQYVIQGPITSPPGNSTGPWQMNWVGKVDASTGDAISWNGEGDTVLNVGDQFRYRIQIAYAQHYGQEVGLPASDQAFVKFSGKAFEVVDNSDYTEYDVQSSCRYNIGDGYEPDPAETKVTKNHVSLQYVVRKDGGSWADDAEMYNARYNTEDYLVFDTVEELEASGKTCVGFLIKTAYPKYANNNAYHLTEITLPVLRVKTEAILDANGTMLDSERVNERVYPQVFDLTDIYVHSSQGPKKIDVDRLSSEYLTNPPEGYDEENYVNVAGQAGLATRLIGYQKTIYDTKAQESPAELHKGNERIHASKEGSLSGSSIKINAYSTYVSKAVEQKTAAGQELTNFRVERGQRRVDYSINGGISVSTNTMPQLTDTVTIVDTLPSGLYPVDANVTETETADIESRWDIAYGGIAVQTISTNGGAGVLWEDDGANTVGDRLTESGVWQQMIEDVKGWTDPSQITYELSETKDNEGNTILTWKINNYPVGYALPTIHYGAQIGTSDESSTDVSSGDMFTNRVQLYTENTGAKENAKIDSVSIGVVKISGGVISKYALQNVITDAGDDVGFTVNFSNAAPASQNKHDNLYIVDVLPYFGDRNGSTDPGNYYLDNVKLSGKIKDQTDNTKLTLYYSLADSATVADIASGEDFSAIDFTDRTIWEEPEEIELGGDGHILNEAAVQAALQDKKITAVCFVGEDIGKNSTLSLTYEYEYENASDRADAVNTDMLFSNTAWLQMEGTIQQQTLSNASIIYEGEKKVTRGDESGDDENNKPTKAGELLTYTITYTNRFDYPVTVDIFDQVPEYTTFVKAGEALYSTDAAAVDSGGQAIVPSTPDVGEKGELSWKGIKLSKHGDSNPENKTVCDTVSVTFTVKIDKDVPAGTIIENEGSIAPSNGPKYSTNKVENPIPEKNYAVDTPNGADGATVHVGDKIKYEIAYVNTYAAPTTIVIKDTLSAGLTYVAGSGPLEPIITENENGTTTLTWTIYEVEHGSYKLTYSAEVNNEAVGKVINNASVQVGNDPATDLARLENPVFASLIVEKMVTGNSANKTKNFTFTVTLDDNTINGQYGEMDFVDGEASFTLRHDESKTATGLPANLGYSVKESGNAGYSVTSVDEKGTLDESKTMIAVFTNHRELVDDGSDSQEGTLTISKTVIGEGGDREKSFTFVVTLSAPGKFFYNGSKTGTISSGDAITLQHGESITIRGIPAGTRYEVVEQEANQDGYTTSSAGETGTISSGKSAAATFVNSKSTTITPPDEPLKPDQPVEPDKPADPDTPAEPGKTPEASHPEIPDAPATGDLTNLHLWMALFISSACALLFIGIRKWQKRSRERQ